MEVHGRDGQYTRIRETPEALVAEWSKRDAEINGAAAKFGVSLPGNGAFHAAVQRMTRAPKQHGLDPEERHRIWREDAGGIVPEIDAFIESRPSAWRGRLPTRSVPRLPAVWTSFPRK